MLVAYLVGVIVAARYGYMPPWLRGAQSTERIVVIDRDGKVYQGR